MNSTDLANYLVCQLFELGNEPNDKTQRIEFKGGHWPYNETSMGGMNENALRRFFAEKIAEFEKR